MSDSLPFDIAAVAQIKAVPILLDIACRSAGLGFTAVARVTETGWIACAVRDDTGFGLPPEAGLEIGTTLCHQVKESRQILVIEDVAADQHFCQHPMPARYGFQSYISAPILLQDGSFFGTLCGFDKAPRPLKNPDTIAMFETFAALIGFHVSAADREAENEANLLIERQTSALREQFIAVLGHDLRNPLTAILGGMEMLRKNPLNDRASQWAEMVVASAKRMAEMIDVVMDFSRSRLGGGLAIDCVLCDAVEPVLRHLVAELKSSKPSRVIQDSYAMPDPIFCDLRRIAQLTSNLLSNAINYGDPDQPIHVEATTRNGSFELSVANACEPIPEPLLANIFEPFSRGAVQPSREGLGLGLYISHQIAKAHGGTLTVVSRPEETRFTFRMKLEHA